MLWTLVVCLTSACGSDYVYIQSGRSETQVKADYLACADEQQRQFTSTAPQNVSSTSNCMEGKGYRALKIERASHPDRTRVPAPPASAFPPNAY